MVKRPERARPKQATAITAGARGFQGVTAITINFTPIASIGVDYSLTQASPPAQASSAAHHPSSAGSSVLHAPAHLIPARQSFNTLSKVSRLTGCAHRSAVWVVLPADCVIPIGPPARLRCPSWCWLFLHARYRGLMVVAVW